MSKKKATKKDVLFQPLTIEQIRERKDGDDYITGVVAVDLGEVIDTDLEGFLNLISERLTDTDILMGVSYNVVGHEEDTLWIEVTGDTKEILENSEGSDE
jgi:hypothetical protein